MRKKKAATTSPEQSSPEQLSPEQLSPELLSPELLSPELLSPELLSPELLSPELLSPELLSPELLSPELLSPELLSPEQLIEHVKQMSPISDALIKLNEELIKWRYQSSRVLSGEHLLTNDVLSKAIRTNLEFLKQNNEDDILDKDWKNLSVWISQGLSLNDILDMLNKYRNPLNSELFLLSLISHHLNPTKVDSVPEVWQQFEARLKNRWLGRNNLSKKDLIVLVYYKITNYNQFKIPVPEIMEDLEMARQLVGHDNPEELSYVYWCERTFYTLQGYPKEGNPINRMFDDIKRLFEKADYLGAITTANRFISERHGHISLHMKQSLDTQLLKSHSAEYALNEVQYHKDKATQLLPKEPEELQPQSLPMMIIVYNNLDMYSSTQEACIQFINYLTRNFSGLSSTEKKNQRSKVIPILQHLAEATAKSSLSESLCLYYILLGDRFSLIFPEFTPSKRCKDFQEKLRRIGVNPSLSLPEWRFPPIISHMFHTLIGHGYFDKAQEVGDFLLSRAGEEFMWRSGYFSENGFDEFYSKLHSKLAYTHFAIGNEVSMEKHFTSTTISPVVKNILHVLLSSFPLAHHLTESDSDYERYQLIVYSYYKLIYLTRRFQLIKDEEYVEEQRAELRTDFFEIWRTAKRLIDDENTDQNIYFMAGRLSDYFSILPHIFPGETAKAHEILDSNEYYEKAKKTAPNFFSRKRIFYRLEKTVFNHDDEHVDEDSED